MIFFQLQKIYIFNMILFYINKNNNKDSMNMEKDKGLIFSYEDK